MGGRIQDQFAGFLGLGRVRFEASFTPAVEIGYRLMPGFWRRGIATEPRRPRCGSVSDNSSLRKSSRIRSLESCGPAV